MSGIDDIVESLEISQPAFFRYFPSKDAVLGEVGIRGFACITDHLRNELSSEAMTAEHLRRLYQGLARHAEADRPLWQARGLSRAVSAGRSPGIRQRKEWALGMFRVIGAQGQNR